ncbi:MAG: ATP-grasp domain-containing protein [Candidatus Omnitrophica bacterium]|nr:ATP-grasp domain-containing protein [Candidatus Omnitrophota bacterium]
MGMTIGLTYDLKDSWNFRQNDPQDANAEFDKPQTVDRVVEALESGGHRVLRIGNVEKLLEQIAELDVDLVFNMCEGVSGRNREMQVPMLLEMYNIPFVGADALTLGISLDKVAAKKMFMADNISTAKFFVVDEDKNLSEKELIPLLNKNNMRFPLMVKTRHEGSSKGINENSRVTDIAALVRQVRWIHNKYHQSALVEEFIHGSEFTVAVLGNNNCQAMPVVQYSMNGKLDLGEEFYTNQRLIDMSVQYICPAKISEELTLKLQDLAVKAYKSIECRDLGRVDFRVDENGQPYVLEINPLPSLEKGDVFDLFPKALGTNFAEKLNEIINFAAIRYGLTETATIRTALRN